MKEFLERLRQVGAAGFKITSEYPLRLISPEGDPDCPRTAVYRLITGRTIAMKDAWTIRDDGLDVPDAKSIIMAADLRKGFSSWRLRRKMIRAIRAGQKEAEKRKNEPDWNKELQNLMVEESEEVGLSR